MFQIRINIKLITFVFLPAFTLLFSTDSGAEHLNKFRFSLFSEPHVIDPAKLSGSESHYILSNLFRGLFAFDDEKGLVSLGAKKCVWQKNRTLLCYLDNRFKWSDGSLVTAEDYVRSFQHFVDPLTKSRESGILKSLKNAKKIINSEILPEKLGVKAVEKFVIEFSFDEQDEEFIYKLSSPLLVPLKIIPSLDDVKTHIFNGPFIIKEWIKGKRIVLTPNSYYPLGFKDRPELEIFFIEEAATALDMYKVKKLDFVLELPISEVSVRKNDPDFFRTPLARFDYIGFGPELMNEKQLRIALAQAVNYEEFKTVFDALGRPGCPSLPDFFMKKTPCYNFDLSKAKEALSKVSSEVLQKRYKLYFTKIPSNNLKMVAEWYQAQWKKNLGIEVELTPMEYGMYRQKLRNEPPSIFRVGVILDRPTCLAALESFQSENPDNFIKFKNKKYDEKITKLFLATSDMRRKQLCTEAIETLLNEYVLIPQGQIHFARLLNPNFKGLKINSMGHIDFSEVRLINLQNK